MNDWAANHPEEYREIAALPLHQQNAALRDAIGYDPDRIRDEYEENLSGEPASPSSSRDGSASNDSKGLRANAPHSRHVTAGRSRCEVCGAGPDDECAPWCRAEQVS